jgi:hypothetical protein
MAWSRYPGDTQAQQDSGPRRLAAVVDGGRLRRLDPNQSGTEFGRLGVAVELARPVHPA